MSKRTLKPAQNEMVYAQCKAAKIEDHLFKCYNALDDGQGHTINPADEQAALDCLHDARANAIRLSRLAVDLLDAVSTAHGIISQRVKYQKELRRKESTKNNKK